MQYSTDGMRTLRLLAITCAIIIAPIVAYGQSNSGTGGEVAVKAGTTVTLDQAIKLAKDSSLTAQLNSVNQEIARDANKITHGQNGINLSASSGYSHVAPYGTTSAATSSNSLSSKYPVDQISAGLKASTGSASSPSTSLSLQGNHEIASTNPLYQASTISASLSQTVWNGFLGGKAFLSNNLADITLAQKILSYQLDSSNLIYQVRQSYYAMASAQDAISLDRQIIEQRKKDYDQTKTLFDAGKDTAVDVMQAQVNQDTANLALSDAQDSLSSARQALSLLIGVPLDIEYHVQAPPAASVPAESANQLIDSALGRRLDLQQLLLAKESASLTTTLDKTAASPIVTADAGVNYTKDWNAKTASGTWNAGVQVNVPIYDSGTIRAQVHAAQLGEQSAQLNIDQLRQSISQTVQQNYDSVHSLARHVQLAQQSANLAQKQYELIQIQFRQGTVSQLDVLNDSVALSQARTSLEQARTQLQLAILKLENSIGN